MPYAYDILEPLAALPASFSNGATSRAADARPSTPPRPYVPSPGSLKGAHPDRAGTCPVDPRIFRPEVFDAVWPRIVGVRAAQAQKALTPEAWRRAWLNGYAHLRERDPDSYATGLEGAARAITVLAPVMRRIEADFRKADALSGLSARTLVRVRCAPSAVTLLRWQDAEAKTRARAAQSSWTYLRRL